jgi:prepilin-type N-terminal cleavage/methylation domain-containing protein
MTTEGTMQARLAREEHGFTLVELLIVMILLAIIMGPLVDAFVSGTNAAYVTNSRLSAQQDIRTGLERIEYEGRCGSSATLLNSGAGVSFTLPTICSHLSPAVAWCISGGVLTRYLATTCTGTGEPFARNITSPTPFSLQANTGDLQEVLINLTANATRTAAGSFSVTDAITLRNSSPS